MFAGHLGAALILKPLGRVSSQADAVPAPNVSLGTLFFCAMLLDFILWILILFGVEFLRVPPDYHRAADLRFDFPYSHSLVASILWSVLGFFIAIAVYRDSAGRVRFGLLMAAAIFSHFILDWLVHVPELPLLGENSAKLGLGLWRNLPLAWTLEALILAIGLWLYLRLVALTLSRKVVLITVMLLVMIMTILGQASTSPPPKAAVMAASSLLTIALLTVFAWWIERPSPAPNR